MEATDIEREASVYLEAQFVMDTRLSCERFLSDSLDLEEEMSRVWGLGALSLKPGILRLQPWVRNSNLYTQKIMNAQI